MEFESEHFSRAFGDSLRVFLDARGTRYAEAARVLNVTGATLSTYWTDDKEGKRKKARVELLFRACIELGFEFEYGGYRITAQAFGGSPEAVASRRPSEQLNIDFSRQFNLAGDDGQVLVRFERRQPGRVEFSVSLEAAS
jgi:hypothetical protein